MKYKFIKSIIIVIAIGCVVSTLIPIPIHKRINAYEVNLEDMTLIRPIEIDVQGKYYINLFESDQFKGHIYFEDYALTHQAMDMVEVGSGKEAFLYYETKIPEASQPIEPTIEIMKDICLGKLYSHFLLSDLVLIPNNHISSYRVLEALPENEGKLIGDDEWFPDKKHAIISDVETIKELQDKISRFNID